ncbi:pathogenicity-like protein [Pseudoxanthomonas sp.]|uniref:pathogenicity-like protein n=1 Tax=Pseudoxanthomonas sp. TaxID=1871049 RepID=UPI003F7D2B61
MRQIFTSQRLETVEGVAKLLRDAGIEVHISNERSYRGKRGSQFRYTEPVPKGLQPAVWVRHPEDQPRARQILREAGLLETTRPGAGPAPLTFTSTQDDPPRRNSWAWRIRLILLGLIAVAAVFTVLRHRAPRPAAPAPAPATAPTAAPAPPAPADGEEEDAMRVQVKPASGN